MLAATNRADVLDAALMRPGRFDVQLHVPLPNTPSRRAILEVHTRSMPLDPTVDLQVLCLALVHVQGLWPPEGISCSAIIWLWMQALLCLLCQPCVFAATGRA